MFSEFGSFLWAVKEIVRQLAQLIPVSEYHQVTLHVKQRVQITFVVNYLEPT